MRRLLEELDTLATPGSEGHAELTGVLRIGAADSVVLNRLPGIVKRFQERHPGVRVHVRTGASPAILAWVREGECDVGLCMLPEVYPGLSLFPKWEDHFVGIVPAGHALAGRTATLREFASERQIAIHPDTLSFQVVTAAYHAAGLTHVPDMVFDTFHLIVEFVTAGVGVGIVSKTVAAPYLERGELGHVELSEIDGLTRRLGIVLHAELDTDGPLEEFLEEIERSLA